ncbi:MFS transporter [Microbacterium sp. ASV49]|uniref:MFS transporter n=1 Tax=Microbacterium candidum TaxID=3041922 RepID=A0ABT7MZE4_9MICO|nr:MFS transporter [Microbacterium sp. ASV49]MDL9979825.1 MFS transporter [Microbacterium sp. ASV49]
MSSRPPARLGPLYLAGFTTAFGAHGVAAALGVETGDIGLTLLGFGVVLALYDLAEVLLKPVFGALSDRVGVKPVIVGGLAAFAAASLIGVLLPSPIWLGVARFAQGAAASAFSPASSSAVARVADPTSTGRYFGRYGSWKSLGYALGPLLGAFLVWWAGMPALFAALSVLALGATVWVAIALPRIPVLPRKRATLADLAREVGERSFLVPTLVLAATTGALGVAVGFLPLLSTHTGLGPVGGMATVTVLALASTLVQPWAGRRHDAGRLPAGAGTATGLVAIAVGLAVAALVPGPVTLYLAALLIGAGVGLATPLAFAHLAASTPADRMGRTMGSAELGRELGDAAGPLIAGAVGAATTASLGIGVVAIGVAASGAVAASALHGASAKE